MNTEALANQELQHRDDWLTDLARAALSHYEVPESATVRMLNLSENATFLVHDAQTGYKSILRIHRPGYHTEQAIHAELAWLAELRDHSAVATAQPIPAQDGRLVLTLYPPSGLEPRYAVMFSFLEGREPNPEDLRSFEQLGAITAHLHEHAMRWPEASSLTRHTWDLDSMFFGPTPLWGRWEDGVGVQGRRLKVLEKLAGALRDRITAYGKAADKFGLIHADLRLANLLVDGGRVQVIDFDDCGYSWFIYDLASALSFIEDHPRVSEMVSSWLRGYRSVRPLSAEDEEMIPTFIMARRLLLVAWVGSHQESPYPRMLGEGFTEATVKLAERYFADSAF